MSTSGRAEIQVAVKLKYLVVYLKMTISDSVFIFSTWEKAGKKKKYIILTPTCVLAVKQHNFIEHTPF